MKVNIYNNPDVKVTVEEEQLIHFEFGLPGFENLKKYAIIEIEEYNPFLLLHSVEDQSIAMVILKSNLLDEENEFEIPENKLKNLKEKGKNEFEIFFILKIHEDDKQITANVKAPVLINFVNQKGSQIILDDDKLSMDFPILPS